MSQVAMQNRPRVLRAEVNQGCLAPGNTGIAETHLAAKHGSLGLSCP